MTLVHGGQLQQVISQYSIDNSEDCDWLDLSTGISPFSYPIPDIPEDVWRELPTTSARLMQSARQYYQCKNLLPTSGSQAVIQILPEIIVDNNHKQSYTVYIPRIGYKEHLKAWQQYDANIELYDELPAAEELSGNDILVVINPNNPSAVLYDKTQLNNLHQRLIELNGWLVVDEAFFDCYSQNQSMMLKVEQGHLIVLRSIGKFFGLAGLRIGFVASYPNLLKQIEAKLGPWSVNGPAQFITANALADAEWQQQQKLKLNNHSNQLVKLLSKYFDEKHIDKTDLFITVKTSRAQKIFELLLSHKIYIRLCDEQDAIRFGIPNSSDLIRLQQLLNAISLPVV